MCTNKQQHDDAANDRRTSEQANKRSIYKR